MGQIRKGEYCPGCGQICDGRHLDKDLRPPPKRQRSERMEELLRLAVQQKQEEEQKLAAMTPEQRDRYIEEWAARLAPQLVDDGCAIDREFSQAPQAPKRSRT